LKIRFIFILFSLLMIPATFQTAMAQKAVSKSGSTPHWVADLPIPQNESIYLVVKGIFPTQKEAEKLQAFIQQLMMKTPGDGVDRSDLYQGLPSGKYVVGMLFDTKERARWWMDFSYRNQKISKGTLQEVKILGKSGLPYMPSASRPGSKRLLSEDEALTRVKALPDVQKLSLIKKLTYRFTDYPRNGDLRYEIEIMEIRSHRDPLMVDFALVSALNGEITERYSSALGLSNFVKESH
jgi:hypothetical protein